MILAPSPAKQLYGDPFRELWNGLPLYGQFWGGFSVVGYSLPDVDPYVKQALYRIGRSYVFGREHPEERLGSMNRIKVVNRADAGTAQDLYSRYRVLPTAHTDFLIDGFDESVLDALFDTGE